MPGFSFLEGKTGVLEILEKSLNLILHYILLVKTHLLC